MTKRKIWQGVGEMFENRSGQYKLLTRTFQVNNFDQELRHKNIECHFVLINVEQSNFIF